MRRTFPLFVALLLSSVPASAQPRDFNLLVFGLGPIEPFPVELDGNPATIEWMTQATDAFGNVWWFVLNPNPVCASAAGTVRYKSGEAHVVRNLRRIGDRDRMLVIDLDPSDGELPIFIEDIVSRCYPATEREMS